MAASDDLLKQELAARQSAMPKAAPLASDALLQQEVEERRRRSNQVFDLATTVSPDHAAQAQKLAKQFGVDATTAEENRDELARLARVRDLQGAMQASPFLAQQLMDPQFAKLAQDDLPKISAIEDALNFGGNLFRSLAAAGPGMSEGIYGAAQSGFENAGALLSPLVGTVLPQNPFLVGADKFAALRKTAKATGKAIEGDQAGMGFTQKSVLSGMKSLGQNLLAIPASVLSGSPLPMLATMTTTSAGQAYGEARDKGVSVPGATLYGTSQGLIEYATEKIPAIALMRDLGLKSSFRKTLVNQLATEIPGEQVATILQDLNEWAVLNPEKPFSSYLAERPSAAAQTLIATMVATGGQVSIMKAADRAINGPAEQRVVDMLTALKDGAINSKTFERAPERIKAFIASHVKDGPLENLFIPSSQFATYFQMAGIDAEAAAIEMGASNYAEAIATGGDLVIPLGDFITNVAKTEHYDALLPDIRFRQGDMTARERDTFEKNYPDEVAKMRELMAGMQADIDQKPAMNQVRDEIMGQLAGRFDQATSEAYATLYAKTIANLSERSGLGPLALHQKYGMQVIRPMADILTKSGQVDIAIDPLLDRIRAGEGPTDAQINGPSLIEFLRSIGGINDSGGDVRRMEVDRNKGAFVRNLVQLTGHSVDVAASMAREAGYLVDDILTAIDNEASGSPTYSVQQQNEELLRQSRELGSLADYVQSLGIDLATATNQQVRDAMAAAMAQVYEQQVLPDTIEIDGVARPTTNSNGQPLAQTEQGVRNFWKWFGDSRVVDAEGKPLVVYHGTDADISEFNTKGGRGKTFGTGAFFTSRNDLAATYTSPRNGGNIMPVYLALENPAIIDAGGANWSRLGKQVKLSTPKVTVLDENEEIAAALEDRQPDPGAKVTKRARSTSLGRLFPDEFKWDDWFTTDDLARWARKEGYDGVIFRNVGDRGPSGTYDVEDTVSDVYVAFDPTQIKSATGNNGEFDPANPNILFQSTPTTADFATLGSGFTIVDGQLLRNDEVVGEIGLQVDGNTLVIDRIDMTGENVDTLGTIALAAIMGKASQFDLSVVVESPDGLTERFKRIGFKEDGGVLRWEAPRGTFFQSAPMFYSALAKAFDSAKQASMPADQWAAWLKSNAGKLGVKKDEIQWSGIEEFLALKGKEKVGREDIAAYLGENGVQVTEVEKGGITEESQERIADAQAELDSVNARMDAAIDEASGYMEAGGASQLQVMNALLALRQDKLGESDALDNAYVLIAKGAPPEYDIHTIIDLSDDVDKAKQQLSRAQSMVAPLTKYSSYQLPGGENYRELLLTLPEKTMASPQAMAMEMFGRNYNELSPDQWNALQIESRKSDAGNFSSSHWEEKNILAHIRFNDRIDADGKRVLFIEELQSDWGQEGKKKGFAEGESKRLTGTVSQSEGGDWRVDWEDGTFSGGYGSSDQAAAKAAEGKSNAKAGTPSAPFVTDTKAWLSLGIKRMIRYAAENGYDRVAFINGEQSAARYDLSKQVDRVLYSPYGDGTFEVSATASNGQEIARAAGRKNLEEIADTFGKDIAEKIEQGVMDGEESGTFWLTGDNLKVGGEGMKTFYDTIVPQTVNDVLKKLGGGKVSDVTLAAPEKLFSVEQRRDGVWAVRRDGQAFGPPVESEDGALKVAARLNGEMTQTGFGVTDAMKNKVLTEGQPLFQRAAEDKRGFIQFGADRKFRIGLLEKADLSTFLHEAGHFWLEVMGDMAADPTASQEVRDDYAAILKFLKVESREQIGVEQHELFARANEAYLREGKSPSPELRAMFQRFKAWLTMIYRSVQQLNVELSDEVRGVFDRIYASDAEIEAAKSEADLVSLFLDAQSAGMSQAEFDAYKGSVDGATVDAKEALQAKLLREFQRERTKWWNEELDKARADVTAEVDQRTDYNAFRTLVEGALPDGTAIKLDKAELVERYGKAFTQKVPRGRHAVYSNKGDGWRLEDAADILGFESGDALVQALAGLRNRNELIEAEARQRMSERHGDLMTDGTLADEATAALHNERRADVLRIELQALNRELSGDIVPPLSAFRDASRGLIGQKTDRELQPYAYLLAERKAAREAFTAMAEGGNRIQAFQAKKRELLNHYLYAEAVKAREEMAALASKAADLAKPRAQQRIGKAGADYLNQINALLEQYEFKQVSLATVNRRQSLAMWIEQQEALGLEPAIDPILLASTKVVNYREVAIDELRAVRDALSSIEHLARLKNRLLNKRAKVEFDAIVDEMVSVAEEGNAKVFRPRDKGVRTTGQKAADWLSKIDGELVNVRTMVAWLDGGRADGPWHKYFFNPASDAQSAMLDMTKAVGKPVNDLMEAFLKDRGDRLDDKFKSAYGRVTRKWLMSVAFNMGNASNFDKLVRGGPGGRMDNAQRETWTEADIRNITNALDPEDWNFIQGMWDILDNEMFPRVSALTQRVSGVPLVKVEAREFTVDTKAGPMTLRGGYYPLKYDPAFSDAGAKQEVGPMAGLENGYTPPSTARGHTKDRTKGFAAPIDFDFTKVLSSHLGNVIKDLTHREFFIDAIKLLRDDRIRQAIQERIGPQYEPEFKAWLQRIANDGSIIPPSAMTWLDRGVEKFRTNATIVALGYKATTVFAQAAGLTNAMEHPNVGPGWFYRGFTESMKSPVESYALVVEKSGEMRHRFDTIDQTVREVLNSATGSKVGKAKDTIARASFIGINIADRMVTIPTWLAAYRKGIAAGMEEADAIHAADDAVVGSQGAGGAKDLNKIQGARGATRLFTMFYTPFAAQYNRARSIGRKLSEDGWKYAPEAYMRVMMITFIPAVIADLLTARGPNECEAGDAACYAKWLAAKMFLSPLSMVPGVRELANAAEQYAMGKPANPRLSPLVGAIDKVSKSVVHGFESALGDRPFEAKDGLDIFEASGYLIGLPTAQVRITAENMLLRMNGDEGEHSFLHDLLFRRDKK